MENASAHDLGMAVMYARVVIRVARIVPTLMTVLQLVVDPVPPLAVGRVPPLATDAVAVCSLERLSKRAEEEKRAYDARDVTMKDVEHTGTVAKASSSKQPSSPANLVEMIASLNITAPHPSSTFSFNPQTSGSAAITTSILRASSAEDKGKVKEPNPTMIPLPESDNEGEDDAMRGK
ncbi:hypothetical protein B0H14DRAFT_3428542 [Mycena olivaceomarginata]|nr:hypothetical protein B0H14DRAFT_3428542 [Mycena olivaceomarginata]